jgi:hypothetical protein
MDNDEPFPISFWVTLLLVSAAAGLALAALAIYLL